MDRIIERLPRSCELPPRTCHAHPVSFRLDLFANDRNEIWPATSFFEGHRVEVNNVAIEGLPRIGTELESSKIRQDPLGITWIFDYEHLPLRSGQHETSAPGSTAYKAEVLVGGELF